MTRISYRVQEYPAELQKKMYLMKYFREYMSENLFKASYVETNDVARRNLDFLTKYMRTKHAVMFRLSNRVLQVCNFSVGFTERFFFFFWEQVGLVIVLSHVYIYIFPPMVVSVVVVVIIVAVMVIVVVVIVILFFFLS